MESSNFSLFAGAGANFSLSPAVPASLSLFSSAGARDRALGFLLTFFCQGETEAREHFLPIRAAPGY
ncbi:MAG: hypothetical protein B6A08_16650 [Sorangiineae bacterium NIC37A_2]|nr:MAG: hypothetical protein B6A08_16650 [Sorangiineae bacterium NIC37A_2]